MVQTLSCNRYHYFFLKTRSWFSDVFVQLNVHLVNSFQLLHSIPKHASVIVSGDISPIDGQLVIFSSPQQCCNTNPHIPVLCESFYGEELLGLRAHIDLLSLKSARPFSKMIVPISSSTRNAWRFLLLPYFPVWWE